MTPKRAVAYVGVASVLIAWLAAAAGVSIGSSPVQSAPVAVQTAGTQSLADDVQAQTERLRGRMASAPIPQEPIRNPFAFAPRVLRQESRRPSAVPAAAEAAAPAPPPEPVLQLIGVAERNTPAGVVRTAMITAGPDELFMVTAGEALGPRYKVTNVGPDVVELTDLVTSAVRRLTLR